MHEWKFASSAFLCGPFDSKEAAGCFRFFCPWCVQHRCAPCRAPPPTPGRCIEPGAALWSGCPQHLPSPHGSYREIGDSSNWWSPATFASDHQSLLVAGRWEAIRGRQRPSLAIVASGHEIKLSPISQDEPPPIIQLSLASAQASM